MGDGLALGRVRFYGFSFIASGFNFECAKSIDGIIFRMLHTDNELNSRAVSHV